MSTKLRSKEITGFVFYIMSEISLGMVHKFCRQVGFKAKYIKKFLDRYIYEARGLFGVPKFFKHIS